MSKSTAEASTATQSKRRGPKVKTEFASSANILKTEEDIISPMSIINQATMPSSFKSDEDFDDEINPVIKEDKAAGKNFESFDEKVFNKPGLTGPGITPHRIKPDFAKVMDMDEPMPVIPIIRKVALKKITRYLFRLGLEKAKEPLKLIPGVGHTWVCDMRGDEYITGFDKQPEERKRLEKILRVDLGPKSAYWGKLSFRLEDKEHGQIVNFDDPVLGAFNETVYFGMLGSSLIANGLQEYSGGSKPTAEWYIEDREAEAEYKQLQMTYEQDASNKFQQISNNKKKGIAKLLLLPAWGTSDKVISTDLWEFIKKSSENSKQFLDITNKHETEFVVRVLTMDAIRTNILRKNRSAEYYIADVVLGPTVDSIVQKLILPQYAEVREAIQNQVNTKLR